MLWKKVEIVSCSWWINGLEKESGNYGIIRYTWPRSFPERKSMLENNVSFADDWHRVYRMRVIRYWFYYRMFDLLVSDFDRMHRQVWFPSACINMWYISMCMCVCMCMHAQWLPEIIFYFNCTIKLHARRSEFNR